MHFRDGKSRVIGHTTVTISSTSMIRHVPAPVWKRGTGIDESCGSRINSISGLIVFPVVSGLNRREDDAKFLESSTKAEEGPLRESRIAARHCSRTRNSQGLTGNVGRSSAARCLRIVKISCTWQRTNSLYSVIPESESTTDPRS